MEYCAALWHSNICRPFEKRIAASGRHRTQDGGLKFLKSLFELATCYGVELRFGGEEEKEGRIIHAKRNEEDWIEVSILCKYLCNTDMCLIRGKY